MKKILTILLLGGTLAAQAQLHIGTEATMSAGNATVATNGDVNIEGNVPWPSATLRLQGEGSLTTTAQWDIGTLLLSGNYDMKGNVRTMEELQLAGGSLSPASNARMMVASGAVVTSDNNGHINGMLYHQGTGEKFYPIGKNGILAQVTLTDVQGGSDVMTGVEAHNQNPGLGDLPANLGGASASWYWEIVPSGNFEGSPVSLPITTEDGGLAVNSETLTVLQTDLNGGIMDIGGTLSPDMQHITSRSDADGPYVLLGYGSENGMVIHNIITPLEDGVNDHLIIDNIESFGSENVVILLDRYGTEVCRMKNFSNDPTQQTGCDFSTLPAGNYICIVEYSTGKMPPTMITLLK